jgi:hypothetical protein
MSVTPPSCRPPKKFRRARRVLRCGERTRFLVPHPVISAPEVRSEMELKTTSDDVKMIAILALSMNLDLVHAFITSTKFFEALDALARELTAS